MLNKKQSTLSNICSYGKYRYYEGYMRKKYISMYKILVTYTSKIGTKRINNIKDFKEKITSLLL